MEAHRQTVEEAADEDECADWLCDGNFAMLKQREPRIRRGERRILVAPARRYGARNVTRSRLPIVVLGNAGGQAYAWTIW